MKMDDIKTPTTSHPRDLNWT